MRISVGCGDMRNTRGIGYLQPERMSDPGKLAGSCECPLLGHAFGISGTAAYNQMMSLTYAGPNV